MLALCVMEPAKLLQNLGVVGVTVKNPMVGGLRVLELG